jgi:hypothetical protein
MVLEMIFFEKKKSNLTVCFTILKGCYLYNISASGCKVRMPFQFEFSCMWLVTKSRLTPYDLGTAFVFQPMPRDSGKDGSTGVAQGKEGPQELLQLMRNWVEIE